MAIVDFYVKNSISSKINTPNETLGSLGLSLSVVDKAQRIILLRVVFACVARFELLCAIVQVEANIDSPTTLKYYQAKNYKLIRISFGSYSNSNYL